MKKQFFTLLFVLVHCAVYAQDSSYRLSLPGLHNYTLPLLQLGNKDGWLFKAGHDTDWASRETDVSDWKKLKPSALNYSFADRDGRAEGWFRIKISADSTLKNRQLCFSSLIPAAMDIYLDGALIGSFGTTGHDKKSFTPHDGVQFDQIPFILSDGNVHLLAVHVVDYVSPFHYHKLRSGLFDIKDFLYLSEPGSAQAYQKLIRGYIYFFGLLAAVCAAISVLFWLLAFLNRQERNLIWFALCISFFALFLLLIFPLNFQYGLSFSQKSFLKYCYNLFFAGIILTMPFVVAKSFNRKVPPLLKLIIGLNTVVFAVNAYFDIEPVGIIPPSASILICIYFLVSSWTRLRLAQWAIAGGLLASILSATIYGFFSMQYQSQAFPGDKILVAFFALSFPLGLLVHVAMRFKEIISEVRANAETIIRLSEEKRMQSENQQKLLEEEVARQTVEIKKSMEHLQSTQKQLIQSEKMASLGELTAGIAHEIQNPLNFVNNFSEVNKELLAEMNEEIGKGNYNEVKAIAKDITDNEEKINHHGKRADAIVKGMLQHSRSSSGTKEPTDINALCDEYLRLAYHGLRAKDKSFNATMKTDFDETIGKINVIPQDIGRVILNLITNAFYVVDEKKKSGIANYEPIVSVSTKKIDGRVEVKVMDNGSGIPQKILEKIFQPFFTTKPTGQGTGLGLSLSYDIIKAHGGELNVETKEGEGAAFKIILPV